MERDLEGKLRNTGQPRFRSEGERRIAEFLDSHDIRYVHEQGVHVIDRGKPRIWYPDFHLPEFAIYLEYFGMAGNPDYDRGIRHRRAVYSSMGLDLIPLYPWNFRDDWQDHILKSLHQITHRRVETLARKQEPHSLPRPPYTAGRPGFPRYTRSSPARYG